MQSPRRLSHLALLACLLAACAAPSASPTAPTASQTPPASNTPTPSETARATPRPAASRTPSPTPVPTATFPVARACLPLGTPQPLASVSFEEYPEVILDYLNAGGAPEDLANDLVRSFAANLPRPVAQADLTGDDLADMVISLVDASATAEAKPGALLLYNCVGEGEGYRLVQLEYPAEDFGAPRIIHIQDINADGVNELVVSSATCTEPACFEDARILSWDGEKYNNRLDGSTVDLPYPDMQITDFDLNGVFDLEIASNGYGSVAAGPQRQHIRRYAWNEESKAWQLIAETLGASSFRLHVLHDAEAAAAAGDYPVALVLYREVMQDDSLADWIAPARERPVLVGYAQYKLIVISAAQGLLDAAANELDQMYQTSPPGSPGHPFWEMADAYLRGYLSGGPEDGCLAAQTYAATHAEQALVPLGPAVYGYANPEITLLDICP